MNSRAFLSIFRIQLLTKLQYRVTVFASLAIHVFFGLILTTILLLFYRLGKPQSGGMTLEQGITYIWLAQCFISLMPMAADTEVYQKVTSGDFAYELCRPLDLYTHWFVRGMAMRLSNTLMKSGLVLIFSFLLPAPYRMQPPVSFAAAAAALLALAGATLLSSAFGTLMSTFWIWIELGQGLNNFLSAAISVFSGLTVPLAVFPEWLQPILRALPFAGLADFPCALYTGLIPAPDIWMLLGKQLAWAAVIVAAGRLLLGRGLRKTVVQGG